MPATGSQRSFFSFFGALLFFFSEGSFGQELKGDYGGVSLQPVKPLQLGARGVKPDGPGYMRALLATLGVPIPGFLQGFELAMFEVPKSWKMEVCW